MTLSEAIAEARGLKKRGVAMQTKNGAVKVLIAYGRLWTQDGHDELVPFSPTVAQASDDKWRASNDV